MIVFVVIFRATRVTTVPSSSYCHLADSFIESSLQFTNYRESLERFEVKCFAQSIMIVVHWEALVNLEKSLTLSVKLVKPFIAHAKLSKQH